MGILNGLQQFAEGLGQGVRQMATHTARAAARANGVSAGAQQAQGNFNQASANNANAIGSDRLAEQWAFNSGQASMANDFTRQMWEQSAAWNESMFNKSMEFNAAEAQKNREWQEHMAATAYQRAVKDMEKAGLNPVLAVTGGGISTGAGGGSAASVGTPSISGASGAMASGGLMNGISASEGNYTGQMEYMGGMLGLMSALYSGLSSAMTAWSQMQMTTNYDREQNKGYNFSDFVEDMMYGNRPGEQEFLDPSKTPHGQRGKGDATAGYENSKETRQKIQERWRTHN